MLQASSQSPDAIVRWAESTATKATPSTDTPNPKQSHGKRLTTQELVEIRKLTDKGWSTREIAAEIGCDHTTVAYHQRDLKLEAKVIVETALPKLARKVANTKNDAVALKVLQAHDVVPKDELSHGGLQVQIGLVLPGLTAKPEPDLSPATFAIDAEAKQS